MSNASVTVDEVEVVENVLKELGEPVRLSDLKELTKGDVQWQLNPTSQMQKIARNSGKIIRPKKGFYQYDESWSNKAEVWGEAIAEASAGVIEPEPISFVKEVVSDEEILEPKEEDKKLVENFKKINTPPVSHKKKFKVGDIFIGRVTGIQSYGAFISDDEVGVSGLVHYTGVRRNTQVLDINQYFKLGDIVKAKVRAVKTDGLSLVTYDMDLPDYFKNEKIKEKLSNFKPEEPKVEVKKVERNFEFEQLVKHMQDVVGVVSEQAQDKLDDLLNMPNGGLVKFMLSMMDAEKEFKVDLGIEFLNLIEEKMRNRP